MAMETVEPTSDIGVPFWGLALNYLSIAFVFSLLNDTVTCDNIKLARGHLCKNMIKSDTVSIRVCNTESVLFVL